MKTTLLALSFLLFFGAGKANVSDTIHVSHYNISVDTINYSAHTIRAVTELTVHAKMNGVSIATLGLLNLSPDSIIAQSSSLTYSYDDTLLHINLPAALNINDSL